MPQCAPHAPQERRLRPTIDPMMPIAYRLRQFLRALTAHLSLAERTLIIEVLDPGEQLLFERMSRFDQRHCLDVYYTLVRTGHTDPMLLRAALIHDCGKVGDDASTIPLFYYGLFVVLRWLAPWLYRRAAAAGRGVLYPFAIHAAHEQRSALLAEAIGCPPEVVGILRDYSNGAATPQAQALRWADDQN